MKNKKYWDKFYKNNADKILTDNSNFSKFTLRTIPHLFKDKDEISLLDIGCGNGRDTKFFSNVGVSANGIDLCYSDESNNISKGNALSIKELYDVYYLRFFLHTIEEKTTDDILNNINNIIGNNTSYIFIETRSTRGVTDELKSETHFKSDIGTEHYRMLYSYDYLFNKFNENFKLNYHTEATGFAKFGNEDPYILRFILSKKESDG